MTKKKNIAGKITGWFLGILFVLIIAATGITWLIIPRLITENLSEFVNQKSDGFYKLSIENMNRNIFPFSIKFNNVNLISNDSISRKFQFEHPKKNLYSFQAQKIELKGIDFKSLFRERSFLCRTIKITKPIIQLSGEEILQNDSVGMADKIVSEIRPLFKNYLHEIKISKIEFSNAHFGLYDTLGGYSRVSKADEVSLEVLGFHTDSSMVFRDVRFFKTEDVLVKIRNFQNDMGDSLHVATIDTLEYSLKTTDIRAAGFHLSPLFRDTKKNLYEVIVPEVYVKSKSITHFALDDSLKISFLEFDNPRIKFFQKENPDQIKLEDINKFDLYTLVQNQFKKMEIDSFYLAGANLEIYRQPDYNTYEQQFKSIDVILHGFSLDSTSAQNRQKILHSNDLAMWVNGYHLKLEDNQHEFRADSLFVSTFSRKLGVQKIQIMPVSPNSLDTRTEVNIKCNALTIEEVDLRNLYHTRTLPTSKIEIQAPDVHLQYHHDRKKIPRKENAGLLFELVTDYLRGVYSNLVYIENGKMNIQNRQNQQLRGYFETNFNFSLTDFALDSASLKRTDKFFYATNFDLHFSDYHMRLVDDLHKLEVKNISISSLNQHVIIDNFNLHPVSGNISLKTMQGYNRSELYNISVPKIDLQGVDLNNVFLNNKLKIDHFLISNPTIYFENFGAIREARETMDFSEFYQLVFNYINDFDIKRFSVPNGKLTWINHTRKGKTISFDNEFSASLDNFILNRDELSKKRLFFSDNFDVTISDQQFELSDSVHVLKTGEIRLSSSNSRVNIKDALLYPLVTSENYPELPTTFQVSIPELIISNFNFSEAYYSQNPTIEELELISPKFQVYNQSGKVKSLELNKYNFPLPSFIQSLQIKNFKINKGEVITYESHETYHQANAVFKFNLSMPELLLKNNHQKRVQLTSRNIIFNIRDFKAPLGKNHQFLAKRLSYNKNQQTISIDTLKVEPFLDAPDNNLFNIFVPGINFTSFDFQSAVKENKFIFNEINISNPTISININKKIKDDTIDILQTLDLYPYAEPLLDQIKVNTLKLNNANLNFNWLKKRLFNNEINLEFTDIFIAENQPPSNFLNSREFELSTTGLKTKSKNNLYEFAADSLIYNSSRHHVLLTNLSINPHIPIKSFPKQKGFQTDVVNARIDFAEIQGINEKRWLQNNVLDASLIKIGPSRAEIFRNKRYPFNQNQRPPWPQDLIKNIPQPFIIDSLALMPSHVRYSELLPVSDQPGYVEFNNLSFTGGTLSNIEKNISQAKYFILNARTQLYNESELQARFEFDMTSPDYYHTVTGSLLPMQLTPINRMLEESAPMSIESGRLDQFDFTLSLDDKSSEGLLYMGYEDLELAIFKYKNQEQKKARFASLWANKLIVNSHNPSGNNLEPVRISYDRDIKRSIINYWWKSIYSGAKKVLGIEPNE